MPHHKQPTNQPKLGRHSRAPRARVPSIPSDAPVLRAAVRARRFRSTPSTPAPSLLACVRRLLPTGSKSLAFRAVCSRAPLPQCSYIILPTPAPCGGRAFRGVPRPANGRTALARLKACARSCALMGAALPLVGRIGRDAPARSATLRAEVCSASAWVFRPCGAPAVQLP